jgi:hypothetical protein
MYMRIFRMKTQRPKVNYSFVRLGSMKYRQTSKKWLDKEYALMLRLSGETQKDLSVKILLSQSVQRFFRLCMGQHLF